MEQLVNYAYLLSAGLFIMGLKRLSNPRTARRGIQLAQLGMLMAVVGTLIKTEIVSYEWIVLGLLIGSAIGVPMAYLMPMTHVPQRTALSHAFGGLAAGLVGASEFYLHQPEISTFAMGALSFEIILGFLTFTGSLMAFGKLQELLPGRPIVYRGQNVLNLGVFAAAVAVAIVLIVNPGAQGLFPVLIALALVFGVLLIMPIGGADMPTVIALLNSYAGLAAAAMGFVLDNKILIVAGALDGSSGLILSIIMCKAMNRSFTNVLFGAFGQVQEKAADAEQGTVRSTTPEEAAMILDAARSVIIVPGYGLAVAKAQHKVRELSDLLRARGVDVKFAIHPVAGRMPGHMNVLLAEAEVSYDQLVEMDEINPEFAQADVALVVGANDVTNPAAKSDPSSPIYGMPILEVANAQSVMVIKRGMSPGFAGVDNELFYLDKTMMLFGDAKSVVGELATEFSKYSVGV